MREVTKIMIKKYSLDKLKYDFMGYPFNNVNQLSFHHLIVPHRLCKKEGLGEGYVEWNGAILRQNTSHDYLHTIEKYDLDMFNAITSEMIDENIKGFLDIENIMYIDDVLRNFEREYSGTRTKKGGLIIKPEYTRRLIKK
jgi:hypothetical protein